MITASALYGKPNLICVPYEIGMDTSYGSCPGGVYQPTGVSPIVYKNWPRNFPTSYTISMVYPDDSGSFPFSPFSFNYNVLFDDGQRLIIQILNDIYAPASYAKLATAGTVWIYDPVIWSAWVPENTQNSVFLSITSGKYSVSQVQQITDSYVKQVYDNWKSRQTSFLHDVIPLAAAFVAIVLSAGALSQPAAAVTTTADVGATATASSIPTYIAASTLESGIPEYIAAATPGAILPVDAALGTDASILGLTGGVTAETGIYGTVENVISSAKDMYAQAKPAISTIAKLDAAYKAATIKPTVKSSQAAQPTGAPASVGALIPIGLILGLFLLSA